MNDSVEVDDTKSKPNKLHCQSFRKKLIKSEQGLNKNQTRLKFQIFPRLDANMFKSVQSFKLFFNKYGKQVECGSTNNKTRLMFFLNRRNKRCDWPSFPAGHSPCRTDARPLGSDPSSICASQPLRRRCPRRQRRIPSSLRRYRTGSGPSCQGTQRKMFKQSSFSRVIPCFSFIIYTKFFIAFNSILGWATFFFQFFKLSVHF